MLRNEGFVKCKAYVYDVCEKMLGVYIPIIDMDKMVSLGEQRKSLGITRFDFNKEKRTMKLSFDSGKKEEKPRNNHTKVKYMVVKKMAGAENGTAGAATEEVPKELTVGVFSEIFVGLYVDVSDPPLEIKFKILRQ